jgi:DNA (cytosine-5)-methyltransferase 1
LRQIGSLYSGIAGLELGVLAAFVEAGLPARIAWQCEIDPFCTRVLAHHFPDVPRFSDVATVHNPPNVDVLCGGFACQDVSSAGKGAGLGKETRSGFTLHHLLRIIDEIRPRFLAIENVASGAKRWLPRVVQELVDRGYRPRAVPLGAIDVGAPHRRLRVFVVADRQRSGLEERGEQQTRGQQPPPERSGSAGGEAMADGGPGRRGQGRCVKEHARQPDVGQCGESLANAAGSRREGADRPGNETGEWRPVLKPEQCSDAGGDRWAPQPGMGGDAHGILFDVAGHAFPAGRGAEQYPWEAPRAIGGDVKVPDRPAKLRALGNAVVPQCGLVVGRILIAMGA